MISSCGEICVLCIVVKEHTVNHVNQSLLFIKSYTIPILLHPTKVPNSSFFVICITYDHAHHPLARNRQSHPKLSVHPSMEYDFVVRGYRSCQQYLHH